MTQGDSVELVIERVFDAPREMVWRAWTEPEHIVQWWGPRGCTTRVEEFDFRPGGAWRYVMLTPDGSEMPQSGVFREIVARETIVTSAEFGVGADLTQEVVLTWRFEDLEEKTKLAMRITHPSAEIRRQHEEMGVLMGWNSNFDSLDDYIPALAA